MRRRIAIPLYFAFALFSGLAVFITSEARAACCMCYSPCAWYCSCPGTTGCPRTCAMPDAGTMMNSATQPLPDTLEPINVDRLIRHAGAIKCSQNNSRLKLLEKGTDLKFEPDFMNQNYDQNKQVARLQTVAHK